MHSSHYFNFFFIEVLILLLVHLRFTVYGMESLVFLTTKLSVFQKNLEINGENNHLDVSKISSFKNENIEIIVKNNSKQHLSSKVILIFFIVKQPI